MSGAKRKTKYRKGVESEILDQLPEPQTDNEYVVRVLGLRGGNIVEVETAEMCRRRRRRDAAASPVVELCRLPQRFKNVIWVKRGSFLIAERASETDFDGKVRFLCQHVLFTPDSLRNLKLKGMFPEEFEEEAAAPAASASAAAPQSSSTVQADKREEEEEGSGEEEEQDFSMQSLNRRRYQPREKEEASSSDED